MRISYSPLSLLAICAFPNTAVVAYTSLAGSYIQTRTNVTEHAALILDVKDMYNALDNNDFAEATKIYAAGSTGLSLMDLSTKSADGIFNDNPNYQYHLYGLIDRDSSVKDFWKTYADRFVELQLEQNGSGIHAAESVVALNIWMYTVNEVWNQALFCHNVEKGATMDVNELFSIDKAMAYYVGADQNGFDSGDGWSLFNLAQTTNKDFGKSDDVIAPVNEKVKEGYERIQTLLATTEMCQKDELSSEIYHIAHEMVSTMMIPLMQMLIKSLVEGHKSRIKLYTLAIVPQIAACKPMLAQKLLFQLFELYSFDVTKDLAEVLYELQSTFECLGFTCEDVGGYLDKLPICADAPRDLPMVGYQPESEVRNNAKIDLDILGIKILTKMEAFDAAIKLYENGKNSVYGYGNNLDKMYRSLDIFASASKDFVPIFNWFTSYFNDENYLGDALKEALSGTGRYSSMSNAQRAEIIAKTLSYQVMYMHALGEFYLAMDKCEDAKKEEDDTDLLKTANQYWDRGVAYLIGSIEGFATGDAMPEDGVLLYNLANERCAQFGTCDSDGIGNVISEYLPLMTEGQNYIANKDTYSLETTILKIAHLVMIPIIQSVIRYAIKSENLSKNSKNGFLGEGEAYTKSIIPIVGFYNDKAGDDLDANMVIRDVKPVQDGLQVVLDAFTAVIDDFGVDCTMVGAINGINICADGIPSNTDTIIDDKVGQKEPRDEPEENPPIAEYISGAKECSVFTASVFLLTVTFAMTR